MDGRFGALSRTGAGRLDPEDQHEEMGTMRKTMTTGAAVVALALSLAACGAAPADTETAAPAETTSSAPKATEKAKLALTKEQENARRSAEQYLDTMAFSKKGLQNQLVHGEGYSKADAAAGIKALGKVDWKAEAKQSAEQYLDTMPFSHKDLVNQLVQGEHFTKDQAEYAVKAVGL